MTRRVLSRRELLAGVAAGVAGLAGCRGGSDESAGGTTRSPTDHSPTATPRAEPVAVAREFVTALARADLDAAKSLYHPDATVPQWADSAPAQLERTSVTIESLAVTHRNETTAVVRTDLTIAAQGETQRVTPSITLRRADGTWRIWTEEISPDRRPEPPQVAFAFDYDPDGGNGGGSVTVLISSGDAVRARNLFLRAGEGPAVAWHELGSTEEAAGDEVLAGDEARLDGTVAGWPSDVTPGTQLTVLYVAGDHESRLGSFTAPGA